MKQQDIEIFIADFQQKLHTILLQNPEVETVNHPAGLSRPVLDEILCLQPLSLFIPRIYGGRAGSPHHCLSLLEAAGYESLAVSLMLGINGALFLEPLNKYGQQETKTKVYQSFVEKHAVGGLMITEPGFGTDALSMTTSYTLSEKGYHIKGSKHWGGLTGLADFWLVTARKEKTTNRLARDIDLFVVDQSKAEQRIEVKEYFHKLGLFLIPYGLNSIDLTAPTDSRLVPATSGVKMLMDLLHRSRLRISGIGMGFITRILDEAIKHCQQRYVGKKSLLKYDQVQQRLSQLQAWYTINSAICLYAAKVSGVDNDLTLYNLEANSAKAVVTDMMQDAAQSLLQLTGAKGYRRDHIAGRGVTDSRPFQIFEGSNDVMYIQVADAFIKEMIKTKETDLYSFASRFALTSRIAEQYRQQLSIKLDLQSPQRSRLHLGKIVARLITAEMSFDLLDGGFRQDLIENALKIVASSLVAELALLNGSSKVRVIEEYREGGDWGYAARRLSEI
jgi:alkylation response protein AidB-like acyl-CoA dehydrogenase